MMKLLNSPTVQKQETGWIWPIGHSLLTPGLRDEHVTHRDQSPAVRFNTCTLGGTVWLILSNPDSHGCLPFHVEESCDSMRTKRRESAPSRAS